MATITSTGASVKTLAEYLEEVKAAYLARDPDWNINTESPDGNAIEIWSELLANLDEAVVAASRAVDPRTATDEFLDAIANFQLLTRQAATFSTATVDLTGTAGTVVPAGTEFRNSVTDTLWASDSSVTLTGGSGSVNVTCTTSGPNTAGVGDISIIATPVSGLSSVTNPSAASIGTDEESDRDFRKRRFNSVAKTSDNLVDSMYAAVADVENVNRAIVYENFDNDPDSKGLNGNSLAIIADGGTNAAIASAIASKKSPGVNLNRGNAAIDNEQTESTTTPAGNPLTVTFFRPLQTSIYIEVTIEGDFDADTVKDAIVDYANGDFFDDGTGFDRDGFGIADNVPPGKLYTPVNSVLAGGSYATDIQIGTSFDTGALSTSTYVTAFNEQPIFDASTISVVAA